MRISLKNDDGTTMFDIFHAGNIELHDVITGDTFVFNTGDSTSITLNGETIYNEEKNEQ